MIEKAELTDNAMNQIVEVVKPILEKKDKEIERLNNDIKALFKENSNKEKVIIAQDNIIKEVRELLNQEWYSVLRKGTIKKAREIIDKLNKEE